MIKKTLPNKVAAVTIIFWITKIISTAMGESVSDFLSQTFNPYLVVISTIIVTASLIGIQIFSQKYHIWLYWGAVGLIAIFGTMLADSIHIALGIPYEISALRFAILLIVNFSIWYGIEGTLSVHEITTRRRELFYWLTILFTFGLGTALGDYTSHVLNWGTLNSGFFFLILFAIPIIWRVFSKKAEILTFWSAYVMTRPLGASFADWGSYGLYGHNPEGVGFFLLTIFLILLIALSAKSFLGIKRNETVTSQ
ncbi:hypothetical protein BHC24_08160 [Oenococcus oeni]|uniref:COG4705 family protein n=2 Tax=Oenococcus oeni TaxID=1247 RepID=UPI00051065BB|nr:membrane protein [Oenococcus oeni]KGH82483.1 membrane protein [Oenococcus oeni S15]KGH91482.1 membrane protein [Oenococcus oeni S161]PST70302.1 hypothetical protein BHC24_08160 [Oenococcus oeni]